VQRSEHDIGDAIRPRRLYGSFWAQRSPLQNDMNKTPSSLRVLEQRNGPRVLALGLHRPTWDDPAVLIGSARTNLGCPAFDRGGDLIGSRKDWLWRAVDEDRYVLDEIFAGRRDTKAGKRYLLRLLKSRS